MLELRGVTKVYNTGGLSQKALDGVNINFRKSEFAAILGPSGSGKTTLLNIIGGLDHYTSGDLVINEVSTKQFKDRDWDTYRNHRIGFVFQSYNLIPHQTVLQNVKLALTLSGISKREATSRAKKALEKVGLKAHINKRPNQLSGGQAQRVAIARALVNNPEILLADEPTGALDSETSVQIMELLKEVAKDRLVIMVTHNPDLAKQYATRIIELKDGKIISDSKKYDGKINTTESAATKNQKRRRTKMSFFTALGLSFKNLLTKKGRTVLVAFAGSIGIIGIALILAVSEGFQGYVDHIQESTLGSYPLTFEESSADISGLLLGMTGDETEEDGDNDGDVKESMLVTSMVNSIGVNDLKSFKTYLENNYDQVEDDLDSVSYQYSVNPLIYTVDATGALAQLNPSPLFSSLLGGSSLLSMYSSYTSVFVQQGSSGQYEYELAAGREPSAYNEAVLILPGDGTSITDYLVYSLGLRDTSEFSSIMTSIMNGESVNIDNEPLSFSYEDLMNIELKIILPTDLYQYNDKYDVYEDMSDDENYLKSVYNKSENLKIVGIGYIDGSGTGGVVYSSELIDYIIDTAAETDIVKKQLANPEINVISGVKFGEDESDFDFTFADLVAVDNEKLQSAFNVNIDQSAVAAKTTEYMESISNDINADITPIQTAFDNGFDGLATGLKLVIPAPVIDPNDSEKTIPGFTATNIDAIVDGYLGSIDGLNEYFSKPYASLLKAVLNQYLTDYGNSSDPTTDYYDEAVAKVKASAVYQTTSESLAITITEGQMKQTILTKIAGLTTYLSDTFAGSLSVDSEAITGAFTLNFSEEELTRVVTAMFTEDESTLKSNLASLGYQDLEDPTTINFYFKTFEGKENFLAFVDKYNDLMTETGHEDKVIEYTDTTGMLMDSVKTIVDAVSYVLIAFVSISLVVSSIMIGVITYISVYERTKEIGILRAIGASKRNISNIFNAETFIVGFLSGLFGIGISYIFIPIINAILHQFTGDIPLNAYLDPKSAVILVVISVILTLIGGLIPAKKASKKDPVEALRSE